MIVQNTFFEQQDVVQIAKDMLGMRIFTNTRGTITGGYITETEAYAGTTDKASHAYNGRRTGRTEIMYRDGGTVYIYLCYGIHSLLNIVTNKKDIPHAVLIRGIEPIVGEDIMLKRLHKKRSNANTFNGPGNVAKALNTHYSLTGIKLSEKPNKSISDKFEIWIEDRDIIMSDKMITSATRIGVNYAGEDAQLKYRFFISPVIFH